jgi:hypothetical protein
MREVVLNAIITLETEVLNVGDLRHVVQMLDKYRVSDDAELDWGQGKLFVDVPSNGKALWIECGDHAAGDETYDILVETHAHE